ncbi:MAG: DUF3078 domain-containing protein [Bacteroidota bacterium]|jgi:hypothetical protein
MNCKIKLFLFYLALQLILIQGVFSQSRQSEDSIVSLDSIKLEKLKKSSERIKAISDSITAILDSVDAEITAMTQAHLDNKPWHVHAKFSSTITQVTLNNWVGGGQNSVSLVGTSDIAADYKKKNTAWENDISLHYGIIRQGENRNWWKNDDQQQFNSKLDIKAFKLWNYSLLFEVRTQFSPGYNYPDDSTLISDIMAPGYIILASGLDFKTKNKKLTLLAAPVTVKTTVVNNTKLANEGAFGVDPAIYDDLGVMITPGKKRRSEIGGFLKFKFKRQFFKKITVENNLELFSNYIDKPENIDINWGTITSIKILKYFSANLTTNLIYDDDVDVPVDRDGDGIKEGVGPRLQFEQMFGFGFTYKID